MDLYGLIGKSLKHSFSKQYFTEKFQRENIADSQYELFELASADQVKTLIENNPDLRGLNVTIPYKQDIYALVDSLDMQSAGKIGAVNTIKIFKDGTTKGYNSDYYGFRQSLKEWLDKLNYDIYGVSALVLGTGGASKAVVVALQDMQIPYQWVSRNKSENTISYTELTQSTIENHKLIINTTPLGMYPATEDFPPIPYQYLGNDHLLYDLVYNPLETKFMQMGKAQGAQVMNGLEMLYMQAEKSWEIWNNQDRE